MFDDYIDHFKEKICPMLTTVFLKDDVWGFFSPFINRYTMDTQRISKLHNDTSMISMVIKLNNDYTGGELEFPRQEWTNQDVEIGHAVIFSGNVTHPHRVNELTSGVKYSFVGWTWPDTWKDSKGRLRDLPAKPKLDQPKEV
jgi:predicted 2-oxoglutarate/Fe(II)-dependent dioxygenase YbiX